MQHTDVAIIGGGILGLATAYQLTTLHRGKRVLVLEKESVVAQHQTGHNSGVLHSGVYYKPGSLKARNCREGKRAMEQFCQEQGIPYESCGKVIVAVDEGEISALERIFCRGQENGVRCEMIDRTRLLQLEPHAAGVKAIHVPETGIIDFRQVCRRLAELIFHGGGEVRTSSRLTALRQTQDAVVLETEQGEVESRYVVNCGGLQSDRITRMSGQRPEVKIVPFRGEYYQLTADARHLCRNLIYPTPDANFPFLGVHFTRMIHGGVECGPNAVLAFAREGYRKRDVNLRDLQESLAYIGFLKLAGKYWRMGLGEMWRSFNKRAFVKALQRLVPEIRAEHLEPAPAGVRAQAIARDGTMVDDFLIQDSTRIINVCNAPSPAATASLNIGRTIVAQLEDRWR